MNRFRIISAIVISIVWCNNIAASIRADFFPNRLRVENLETPTSIDILEPRLSWINTPVDSLVKDARQTAYRIVVASSIEKLDKGKYDVWDSGKVISEECHLVDYNGRGLLSGEDYFWKVQTWDGNDRSAGFSEPSKWSMGLVDSSLWQASWIGVPWQGETARKHVDTEKSIRDFAAPLFRKDFIVGKKVRRAKVYVSGLGYFELRINGRKVGDDLLVPNFTNYGRRNDFGNYTINIANSFTDYRVLYLAYDVTKQLQVGENTIGAILGNGMYDATIAWLSPFGSPRLLCQLEIEYTDGTKELICSNDSWKTHPSAIVFNDPFDGEIYDARQESEGWDTSGFDDSNWMKAVYRKAPDGKLCGHVSPTDKVMGRFSPISLEKIGYCTWEVEYPVEISGWIRFADIKMNCGDTLEVKYVSDQWVGLHRYIAKDDKPINHTPRFNWYVFSKAIISGVAELKPENLIAEAVNSDVKSIAHFQSSDTTLNQIHTIWRRCMEDNMHGGIASDCPHRERAPYTGDGQVSMNTVMANYDVAAFYRKWLRDMRDAQNPETGYLPNSAPWQPGSGGGVAWGAAMTIMPWEYYLQYGDVATLAENYSAMKRQVGYMLNWLTPENIMHQQRSNDNGSRDVMYWLNLGDWCAPYGSPDDALVHTFYLWKCLDITARAAKSLGMSDDANFYAEKAENISQAFTKKFYNPQNHSYGDFGSNVFALEMGVPDSIKIAVAATLADEIHNKNQGHLNTGIYASRFLFEQLAKTGYNDIAMEAMTAKDFPGFGYWLSQGATVTWEKWDGKDSHNHPMFGGALMWLYNTLAGIRPTEEAPGFKKIIIKPFPSSGIKWVEYDFMSPYGEISSKPIYGKEENILEIKVPVGCSAEVWIPLPSSSSKVICDDNMITEGRLSTDGNYFITTVGHGSRKFIAK